MTPTAGEIRIDLSGWHYRPWRGVFYPQGLPAHAQLAFAAERFRSIEINGTFYRLQRPEDFARWHGQTPPHFVFALKGPRYITHMLKMRRLQAPLANFLASGPLRLGAKLGPILWQFPPALSFAGAPTAARAGGRDVYLYFDNDAKVRAPADAAALMRALSPARVRASRSRPRARAARR